MARNRYFEDELLAEKFNGKMLLRVFHYIKPYKKTVIKMLIFMLLMSFVALLPPYFNRIIADYVLPDSSGNLSNKYVSVAITVVSCWLLVSISEVTFTFFRSRIMTRTGYKVVRDIRRDMYCHLQKMSFDYFDSRPAGKILVRVTSYIDELSHIFSNAVIVFLVDSVKMLLILTWLVILDWRIALITLIVIVPLGICLILLHKKLHKKFRLFRNKNSNRTAFIAENIQGISISKSFNRTDLNCRIYDDLCEQTNKQWKNIIRTNELFWPVMDFFWSLGTIAIYALVVILAINNSPTAISYGVLIAGIGYLNMFVGPLNNIATIIQQLSTASSNLERIFETMDTPPSITDKPDAYELPEIDGEVEFKDLSFEYEKGFKILDGITMHVPAGKTVALVGPTGGGKTTIVNLLSRFYDPGEGKVFIDGHDITKVTLSSLRGQVGVMMQDSFIFSGTIMDNIRYGNLDATDEQCIEAAKSVYAHDFISGLEKGYYTEVSEQGLSMSAGERQLLSFARTVLSDPKILILDEATSNIDTHTEKKIQDALNTILKGRTSFVIAHRLSTIKRADAVLVIKDRRIIESGTHDELMNLKGFYYNLATQ